MIHGRSHPAPKPEVILQLQSLRLTGFKTFASPTLIEFVNGITAVVGSNGSGKSNIVDGLKWVLGEQSLRDLRSRRAEDVIFAGSQARKPASMAEVVLTFGNDGGWLPIDASEVEVGRRLYRSAEGEYLINKERVRLRDVHDLVREGGLDSSGHTIVGQGMVDAVLSLRGIERRGYIASVAGIAPYEARRTEALHRLDQTRQNMVSAQIVLEEIEPRLRLLRRQANLAENAAVARSQLRDALTCHYRRRWNEVQGGKLGASNAFQIASREADALRQRLEVLGGTGTSEAPGDRCDPSGTSDPPRSLHGGGLCAEASDGHARSGRNHPDPVGQRTRADGAASRGNGSFEPGTTNPRRCHVTAGVASGPQIGATGFSPGSCRATRSPRYASSGGSGPEECRHRST